MKAPQEIIKTMMSEDKFSQWLGVSVVSIKEGQCTLMCKVTKDMVNGFNVAHGGISYSLSDSTMAFASNSYGLKCMSIETSISHLRKINLGDTLISHATEIRRGKSLAIYEVRIFNQLEEMVSHFKGTVKISENRW